MSTHKNIDRICVAVLIVTVLITLLFMNGERLGIQVIVDEDAQEDAPTDYFTANDLNGAWDTAGATVITLQADRAAISGSGAYMNQGDLVIAQAGTYVLSGQLSDGSVIVDSSNGSKIWILLNGVELYCSDDACLRIDQAEKVFLTLAEGSENRMESGESYSQTALDDGTGGVIFAHDDLSINGSGSLSILAHYKHGIDANDDLVIAGGSLTIRAPGDAIHCNDSFRLTEAAVTLEAEDDGLVVSSSEGFACLRSGSLTITSGDDAIHAAGDVILEGAELSLNAGDDGIHADGGVSVSDGQLLISQCYEGIEARTIDISGGSLAIYPLDDGLNANGGQVDFGLGRDRQNASAKQAGIESWIRISGGDLLIVNESAQDADGLDSNGDILISGGTVLVSLVNSGTNCAIDYGSESGGLCQISGGTVIACGSYEMAEGFDDSSVQCSILYNIMDGVPADTRLQLLSEDGEELLAWQVPCSFSSVVFSSPELSLGGSYVVRVGDSEETITLDTVSGSFGDAASSMFGGAMNWGGMRHRGGQPPQGNAGGRPDMGQAPDMGDRPTPPDGEAPMGGMPTPPDMSGMPTPPEMGEMPTPPDGEGPMGEMPTPPDWEETAQTEPAADAAPVSVTVSGTSWLLIAACGLLLLAAILLVRRFHRKG